MRALIARLKKFLGHDTANGLVYRADGPKSVRLYNG